ncbi:hypothetical protein Trydic_g11460 [Trypoxylus dichotomus]
MKSINVYTKQRAREEVTPVSQIYRQEMMLAKNRGLDFVTNIPQFTPVEHALYNERHKSIVISLFPKKREGIAVPEFMQEYAIIDDGMENRIFCICNGWR